MQAKISVCIPTYNRKDKLRRAINSVLKQTYSNYEIIVSDNCSTDGTREMINDEYAHVSQLKYFRNEINLGMVPNWRNCLDKATGEYYSILDDDNYFIYEDYLKDANSLISENDNINLVFGDFLIRFKKFDRVQEYNLKTISYGKDIYRNYFNLKKIPQIFFVVLNRDFALKNDFYVDNIITHDVQSFLVSMLGGNAGYIKRVIGIYDLTGDDNIVLTIPLKWKDYINYADRVINYAKSNNINKGLYEKPLKRHLVKVYSDQLKKISAEDRKWYDNKIISLYGIKFLIFLKSRNIIYILYKTIIKR